MIWARRIGFAVGAVYLLLLPGLSAFTRVPTWVRGWHMYSGQGTQICQVAYYEPTDEGEVAIDGLAVISPRGPPTIAMRWLRTPAGVAVQGARVCKVLKATDIRAHARCGTRKFWANQPEPNLCK